jgi:hypothetical protein
MQAGSGGFGSGPEDDAAPVVARVIAMGRLIAPVSRHSAE